MTATVEILSGISGAGKTSRLVAGYRTALDRSAREHEPGTTLWLTPTRRSARAIRNALSPEAGTVCFAPNVMTFGMFAEQILKFSGRNIAPLSSVAGRMLLRNIVQENCREGRLKYFSPIAHTSGFLDLVMSFLSELKRDEIWPEQFEETCRSRGESDKDRELALIYRQYQQQLLDRNRYDAEGRFWSAREALAGGCRSPFEKLSLVVVDGFTDFTHTQYEILGHLAGYAERMLISLQMESPLHRNDLFAKTERACLRIEESIGSATGGAADPVVLTHIIPEPKDSPPAFEQIAGFLFGNPRETTTLTESDGIEILAATGRAGEFKAVAERIKRRLLSGVLPDEIVVAVRNLGESADLIEEVFESAGIGFWCEAGRPLSRSPVVKALFSVIQLEREDWPFARLSAVVHSNYFRPDWKEWDGGSAARCLLARLRALKIPAERKAMLKGLSRAAARQAEASEPSTVNDTAKGAALLERLSAATRPLRKKARFGEWVETLLAVGRDLGIAPKSEMETEGNDASLFHRDKRDWETFVRILQEAARFEREFSADASKFSLAEFQAMLTDLLQAQFLPPEREQQGRVLVLEADQVRNLDVPYLYLCGLTENSFPQNRNDDCLYGERERQKFNELGLSLNDRSSRARDEMLLFYNVVTRARKHLCLSYPSVLENGQPLYSSPYLSALKGLFEEEALRETQETKFNPVPEREQVLTPADFRLAAVAEARENRPGLFRTLIDWPQTKISSENVLTAVEMAAARFHSLEPTPFDGKIESKKHLQRLAERFPADYQFSATELEAYAACAFKFFLSKVLKVEPLESPETSTDYLSRGSLVHDVLATVHGELMDEAGGKLEIAAGDLTSRFRQAVSDRLGIRVDDSDLQKALTQIERNLLFEWGEAYGLQHEEYFSELGKTWEVPPSPRFVELPFGDVPGEDTVEEEVQHEMLSFGKGKKTTFVRGRIDRVDIGQVNNQPVFNVIDYKSGKPPRFSLEDVRSGRALQLALYTLAVQRLDLAGPGAKPFLMGYWSLRETGMIGGLKGTRKGKLEPLEEAVFESLESLLEEIIPQLSAGIRSGDFPVNSEDPDCTSFCPYNTVCRVNQLRPLRDAIRERTET